MKGEQKFTILLHPASGNGFGDSAFELCACRIEQDVIRVVVRPWDRCFDRRPTRDHVRFQRRQETKVEIVIAERGMNLPRFEGYRCSNRVEQGCIEDCSLIEIFGVIRQTRDGSLAQPLSSSGGCRDVATWEDTARFSCHEFQRLYQCESLAWYRWEE